MSHITTRADDWSTAPTVVDCSRPSQPGSHWLWCSDVDDGCDCGCAERVTAIPGEALGCPEWPSYDTLARAS
jgi:hypothetical protein